MSGSSSLKVARAVIGDVYKFAGAKKKKKDKSPHGKEKKIIGGGVRRTRFFFSWKIFLKNIVLLLMPFFLLFCVLVRHSNVLLFRPHFSPPRFERLRVCPSL